MVSSAKPSAQLLTRWEQALSDLLRVCWPEKSPLLGRRESLLVVVGISIFVWSMLAEVRLYGAGSAASWTVARWLGGTAGSLLLLVLVVGQAVAGFWLFWRLERAHAMVPCLLRRW